jgi:NitT/TauT family transport system substrate-binding protein
MMRLALSLVLLLLLAVPACTPEPPAPLRVGTCIRVGCEELYLARDLGYYGDAPVRVVEYSSATEVIRAFRNGAVDAVALSLDEVLLLAQHMPDIRVVLVMNFSNGADIILGKPELKTIRDIKGKRVGVESTALGAYVLSRALHLSGLDRADIRLVHIPVDEQERAYLENRVDAVVTFEPVHSRLEALGARDLFDSTSLHGEMVNVVAVRKEYLDKYPGVVQSLLQGWFRALSYGKAEPRDGMRRMAEDRALPVAAFADGLGGYVFPDLDENIALLAENPPGLMKQLKAMSAFMLAHGLLATPVDLNNITDGRPLQALSSQRSPPPRGK